MPTLPIAIIHGIGKNGPGFSRELQEGIRGAFDRKLQDVLKTSDSYSQDLDFEEIVWDDIVARPQAKLEGIFKETFDRRKTKSTLGIVLRVLVFALIAFLLYSLFNHSLWFLLLVVLPIGYYLPQIVYVLRTKFAAEFVSDIICYRGEGAKSLIFDQIKGQLGRFASSGNRVEVTFIAHSLGTVIASDFIWEQQKPGQLFDQKFLLNSFFTMGSPLPLFCLQYGGPEIFNEPLSIQTPSGAWINIYDKDDPVAYPLKPLNEAYNRAVLKDTEVNVGLFGFAHVNYWKDKKVHQLIAEQLAANWLRLNGK